MKSLKEKLEKAGHEFREHQKDWKSALGTKEEFEKHMKKKIAKKMPKSYELEDKKSTMTKHFKGHNADELEDKKSTLKGKYNK